MKYSILLKFMFRPMLCNKDNILSAVYSQVYNEKLDMLYQRIIDFFILELSKKWTNAWQWVTHMILCIPKGMEFNPKFLITNGGIAIQY